MKQENLVVIEYCTLSARFLHVREVPVAPGNKPGFTGETGSFKNYTGF
jgi:hypothetical protein